MAGWLTSIVEMAVGLGCLAAAWVMWRGGRLRLFAALFAIAGVTATGHAIWALATG